MLKNSNKKYFSSIADKKILNNKSILSFEYQNFLSENFNIISSNFQDIVPYVSYQNINNEICLTILSRQLLFSLRCLKNHIGLQQSLLSCISGVDLLQDTYRFIIVYDFLSITFNSRIRIKVYTDEYNLIPSITTIYINSNWWEREIWDLYGIFFENHLDLRRILNDYSFEGNPMRKDYPLSGFSELKYSLTKKMMVTELLQLSQEYRSFSYF